MSPPPLDGEVIRVFSGKFSLFCDHREKTKMIVIETWLLFVFTFFFIGAVSFCCFTAWACCRVEVYHRMRQDLINSFAWYADLCRRLRFSGTADVSDESSTSLPSYAIEEPPRYEDLFPDCSRSATPPMFRETFV